MKKSVNLLSDVNPASLGKDMDAISESRQTRSAEADFDSYLDFLEETSSILGFTRKKRDNAFEMRGDTPLL
ncbi:MAG: hypothetical protein Q8N12_05770 [Thermodesulfovibrionales bacterium]|nr:hypothetical protein [Nitrospinota bacterium]MCG2778499.1 hypothetical protein [Desulfobacterales bacterium]MDP3048925.1 hypothetical protein [Thermodesulfovibrionales bacterium]